MPNNFLSGREYRASRLPSYLDTNRMPFEPASDEEGDELDALFAERFETRKSAPLPRSERYDALTGEPVSEYARPSARKPLSSREQEPRPQQDAFAELDRQLRRLEEADTYIRPIDRREAPLEARAPESPSVRYDRRLDNVIAELDELRRKLDLRQQGLVGADPDARVRDVARTDRPSFAKPVVGRERFDGASTQSGFDSLPPSYTNGPHDPLLDDIFEGWAREAQNPSTDR